MLSKSPATKKIAPRIHRNAPCRKLVGTNHSSASAAAIGKTNNSGGAIDTAGRSSSGGNSDGLERQSVSVPIGFRKSAGVHRRHSKEENPQARGAATCDSKARSAASFSSASGRKIIQTPARTKQAPRSDQTDNRSPPRAQPSAIAPGGVISEIVCSFVTDMSGISQ